MTPTTIFATPAMPRADGVGVQQRAARTLGALAAFGPVETRLCRPAWVTAVEALRAPAAAGVATAPRLEPMVGEIIVRRAALQWPDSRWVARMAAVAESVSGLLADREAAPIGGMATVPGRTGTGGIGQCFHAFRLAAADAAGFSAGRFIRRDLDLDDLESVTARAIATLAQRAEDKAVAAVYDSLARRLEGLERSRIPRFDRVFVGSNGDRAWVEATFAHPDVRVLPNVVDVPELNEHRHIGGPARFLFVGALDYYPNIDALRVLLDGVLPRLHALRPKSFELHVVGRGGPSWLRTRLRRAPGVIFHGAVPAMAPVLARTDALLAPLRAGGGTRIKLLEAFAAGVPVIATKIGAAGLAVEDGVHLTVADENDAFIAACVARIDDPSGASRQREAAHEFVAAHHHPAVFRAALAAGLA